MGGRSSAAVRILLLVLTLCASGAVMIAQTDQPSPIAACSANGSTGRPTLKRRLATPVGSAPQEGNGTEKIADQEKCKPDESAKVESTLSLRFEGLVGVEESELLTEFRAHPLQEPDLAEKAANYAKEILIRHGYLHTTVNTHIEQVNAGSRTVVFIVGEGPRPGIAEVRFEGNRIFPTQQLAGEIKQCMAESRGNFYNPELFEYCLRKLDYFAYGQGYLKAQFHDPKVEETDAGLIITVQADEGVLYRLGEIKIDGVTDEAARLFRGVLNLNSGDVFNGEIISKWLFEDLKAVFTESGYIQFTADVDPRYSLLPDSREGVVDLDVTIDAGGRYTIRRIRFQGADLQEELQQLMLIHGGELYNQALFEKSIENLNNTGLFESIDRDKNVDFAYNEEERLVDITIKLTKRQS